MHQEISYLVQKKNISFVLDNEISAGIPEEQKIQLAYQFVQNTDRNIFLTGKAGTGKTTFLHNIQKSLPKRMAIVAPTGVAAINAGGVTIHSFFQLPFGPYIPGHQHAQGASDQSQLSRQKKFNKEKIKLLKSLDLLVIDEISMVRADMLDSIDDVLRRYKNPTKPFGGVQLLMIGDLHQLAPVIKDDEWNMLKGYYDTVYFFSSMALQKTNPVRIELTHVYRQSDQHFISLLNRVRNHICDEETLNLLNDRYIPDFQPKEEDGYIILTSHNAKAQAINEKRLLENKHPSCHFEAIVKDDFPAQMYPTELTLELKKDAQVMFVKNDLAPEKKFYNGKIGKVTTIDEDVIYVKCPTDDEEIAVGISEWQNIRYELDETTKEIKEVVIGSFAQYPLKLAWAITIHKSQGLTFEHAIIDANQSFAHGQVYVALSRCRSLEGLVLSSPISASSIKTDQAISRYSASVEKNTPGKEELDSSIRLYQQNLLLELFEFGYLEKRILYCLKIVTENAQTIDSTAIKNWQSLQKSTSDTVISVAQKFTNQLRQLLHSEEIPEANSVLQERVTKACIYFSSKLKDILNAISAINFDTDNAAVKKMVNEVREQVRKEVFTKQRSMQALSKGFSTLAYLHAKSNADIDYLATVATRSTNTDNAPVSSNHPALFKTLRNWRNSLAEEHDVPVYLILAQKAIYELTRYLPSNKEELEAIKGIGKKKVQQYGDDILDMINEYCEEHEIKRALMPLKTPKATKTKGETKKISFDLYQQGKSKEQVAAERGFALTTIEGHLAHYIGTGDLRVEDFVSKATIAHITDYFSKNKGASISTAKSDLGESVSYADLRFVIKHLEHSQGITT